MRSVDAPETVAEAVALLVSLGYTGDVTITAGTARCEACATAHPFDRLVADHVYRFEGMSDPSDEAIVCNSLSSIPLRPPPARLRRLPAVASGVPGTSDVTSVVSLNGFLPSF